TSWASAVQAIVTGKRCDRGEVVNGKLPARRPHEGDATSLNARGVHLRACPGWFSLLRGHFLHFGLAKHKGVSRRRSKGITHRDPRRPSAPDLVQRAFRAERPDQLWVADMTQQHTDEGWLYLAVVVD